MNVPSCISIDGRIAEKKIRVWRYSVSLKSLIPAYLVIIWKIHSLLHFWIFLAYFPAKYIFFCIGVHEQNMFRNQILLWEDFYEEKAELWNSKLIIKNKGFLYPKIPTLSLRFFSLFPEHPGHWRFAQTYYNVRQMHGNF